MQFDSFFFFFFFFFFAGHPKPDWAGGWGFRFPPNRPTGIRVASYRVFFAILAWKTSAFCDGGDQCFSFRLPGNETFRFFCAKYARIALKMFDFLRILGQNQWNFANFSFCKRKSFVCKRKIKTLVGELASRFTFIDKLAIRFTFIDKLGTRFTFTYQLATRFTFIVKLAIRFTFIDELATRFTFIDELATHFTFIGELAIRFTCCGVARSPARCPAGW